MGAPVASGTLAGSTSGSSASIHKDAAGGDFSRFRRHPPVVRPAHLCRPSRSRTSSPGTTPQPSENQQSEIGVAGRARFVRQGGATPRIRGRVSAAAGCGEHTTRRSGTVTATRSARLSQPCGKGIASSDQPREPKQSWRPQGPTGLDVRDHDRAPSLLNPDSEQAGSRSCVGRDRTDGRRDLDQVAAARPGRSGHLIAAAISAAPFRPKHERRARSRALLLRRLPRSLTSRPTASSSSRGRPRPCLRESRSAANYGRRGDCRIPIAEQQRGSGRLAAHALLAPPAASRSSSYAALRSDRRRHVVSRGGVARRAVDPQHHVERPSGHGQPVGPERRRRWCRLYVDGDRAIAVFH